MAEGAIQIDVAKFNTSIADFAARLPERSIVPFHKKIALEAFRRIVLRTPVDTGRARGNWQLSIDTPATGILGTLDKGGGSTVRGGLGALANLRPFAVVWLTNNLPYIQALEDGHSQRQAPFGMVALTFAELERALVTE